jgi:glycosyltransferase involved in cell wall biosynthesis
MLLGYGVDLYVHKLAEGLARLGHEVTVCCNISDDTFRKAPYRIEQKRYKRTLDLARTETNAYDATKEVLNNQDLLVPCTFPYYYVAFRSSSRWVPIDFGVVPPEFYRRRIAKELRYHWRTQYGEYFPRASKIVSISEFLKRRLPAQLHDRTTVIYPGIDHYPDLFLCKVKELYGLEGKVLLYFGRSMDFSPYKNTDSLLRIYRALKKDSSTLNLVISTNCTPEEQRRLEGQGAIVLNGILMHFVPSIYNSADVYLTATLWEGFDLPLLEASYFGLPVVALSIGAHPEIVRSGETGFLGNSEEDLYSHVRRLMDDRELAQRLGQNGKAFARKNFLWSERAALFEQTIAD